MYLAFTICSNNYLAQAVTLGNSLIHYNPDYKFVIGLVDRKLSSIDYSVIPYDIFEVEKIGIQAFDKLSKKYNITELNTAVKPFYFKYLFENYKETNGIIYLDPDIVVFSSFIGLEMEFDANEIIITPHITRPISDAKILKEEDFLNSGLYNLGFIGIQRSQNGFEMINWWSERLVDKAFIDFKNGLFTDQKWIDFVPLFFKNVRILTDPGFNMAYWNLQERSLSIKNEKYYVNDQFPLIFYHFSGFDPRYPEILSKYQNRFSLQEPGEINDLFKAYSAELFLNKYNEYINYPNYYSGIKEKTDREKRKEEIRKIPFFLRIFRILILKVSEKHNLLLD